MITITMDMATRMILFKSELILQLVEKMANLLVE